MKGPMVERMKGTLSERGRNVKHRRQNPWKKGANIDQNGAKIAPKGSQNEAKKDNKSEQRLQDDLGPVWGAISPLLTRRMGAFWNPKSSQIRKKTDATNR